MSKKRSVQKILIVDDSEMNREILSEMLGAEYEIIEAEDGSQAVAVLQRDRAELSLVLLDVVMPVMDGYEVLRVMNANDWLRDVPVIMISSERGTAFVDRAYELGAVDFISRPFDARIVRRRVVNTILLYAKQKKLEGLVTEQIYEKEKNSRLMVAILSHIVEFRNGESGLHVLHVQNYTEILLRHLMQMTDQYNLSGDDIGLITNASALHDIGKISIPDEVLNKPGRLTPEEFETMKTHSAVGASMLEALPLYQNEPLVKCAYEICRWHHERYNGSGYPDGLKGDEIPISAQVVSLADVYDALTSERVYKKAFPHEKAVEMIISGACGAFNPLLIQCFTEAAEEIRRESESGVAIHSNEWEIKLIADEMLRHGELSSSERTLNLFRHERMKNSFFSEMSEEIFFEYTQTPATMSFSAVGAARLGVGAYIMEPFRDKGLLSVIAGRDLEALCAALCRTTPREPAAEYRCRIKYKDGVRPVRIVARAVWSEEEPPRYLGAVGKIEEEEGKDQPAELCRAYRREVTGDDVTGVLS